MSRFRETRRTVGRSSSRWSFSAQGSGSSNEYSILNDPDLVAWYDAKSSTITQADATERVSAWSDLSGHGYNLLQATPTAQLLLLRDMEVTYLWLPGNNTSNSATAPHIAAYEFGSGSFSVEAWVTLSTITDYQIIVAAGVSGGGDFRAFEWNNGTVLLSWDTDASLYIGSTAIVSVNTLSHLVWGYDAVAGKSFTAINGVYKAVTEANHALSGTNGLYLGSHTSNYDKQRKLYAVRLYDVALTEAQISANFAAGAATTTVSGAVFNADITRVPEGTTSFTESSANAATVTINTSGATPAQIVAAGQPSVLFDGVAYNLQATFTLNQPETIILVYKAVSWTVDDYIFDGISTNSMGLFQNKSGGGGASPNIALYAGGGSPNSNDLNNATVGTYHIVAGVFNADNSTITVDLNSA